ncbi:HhH-GPD-type base excision DNA repair protein [uncultured Nocardioides sp.]|uniref:HhH-GPD-type base excision DNA repair protein n=1 Tax=uncultured Nocardioides sp. TaxID=198441 RepID=UPI0026135F47|nr:HhH-GPD-type base excision DNA repair protein [uncultured Nocardioides sp.]
MALHITGDEAADQVLDSSPFALLAGMMLDQQFPMEAAFAGPAKVADRLGTIEPAAVADADPEEFKALCATPPAVHRFPGSMAARLQELARIVVETYDGDASRLWSEATDGADLKKRLTALPGFGDQKARIFVALLAKQCGVRPDGWEKVAGDYAQEGYRSVADVTDGDSLLKVRAFKKEKKAAAKR